MAAGLFAAAHDRGKAQYYITSSSAVDTEYDTLDSAVSAKTVQKSSLGTDDWGWYKRLYDLASEDYDANLAGWDCYRYLLAAGSVTGAFWISAAVLGFWAAKFGSFIHALCVTFWPPAATIELWRWAVRASGVRRTLRGDKRSDWYKSA